MPTIELIFIAGLLTGIPSSIAAVNVDFIQTPIDHTRILLQLQKKTGKYNGSVDAGIKIYKQHGIKGLYLGFYPTLLREVIAMAVYFSTFEIGMKMFV